MQKLSLKKFLAILTTLLLMGLVVWAGWFRKENSNSQVATGEKVISLQATLESAGLPGKEVLKSFASMDSLAPQKTNSGFEIKDSLQNSASDSTEKNDFKINFPANYKEHINLTLAPNKVITVIDKQASSAEGQLLADQNDQKNPAYVEYKLDKRKSIFYAYQKNQIGAQKLKNWILYQSGNGSESESYQFENAKIVLDSKNGNASVAFADKTENPTFALPLQIPKPFFLDKDGIRTDLAWKLNEAGDTLSVDFSVSPDKYPIVLDPTIIPSQFSIIGAVKMKGAVKFVTNGERTAYVAPSPFAPINTAIPPLFGTTATTGETVSTAPGVWSATPSATYAYQWKRSGSAISGATGSSYVIQAADAGNTLGVTVTATNSAGSASATSASTGAVVAPGPSTVEYLVVAGGGGGGGAIYAYYDGAGGGGGGFLTSSGYAVSAGSSISVTVGNGGLAGQATTNAAGGNGGNSVFGSITVMGGGGGGGNSDTGTAGANGGSGGGARVAGSGGLASQGYRGGDNSVGSAGAGGGGACGAAANVTKAGFPTSGGSGCPSAITGSLIWYAGGGGGGGFYYNASGATGGGGAAGVAGTANTGGGGGGMAYDFTNVAGVGNAGGSGIVVIRYPDTYADAASTTGSPTFTNTGGYKIYKWINVGSGSITFSSGVGPAIVTSTCDATLIAGQTCVFGGLTYGAVTGADGKIWLDRNLGAPQVAISTTDSLSYGWLYQWGRNTDGHQTMTSSTTSTLSSSDTPGHVKFIMAPSSPNDWRSGQNNSLWQGVSGTNNPCPSGFRVPTQAEWSTLVSAAGITNPATALSSTLKLSLSGGRNYYDASLYYQGTAGYCWSSTVTGSSAYLLSYSSSGVNPANYNNRAFGLPVRCVKN